MRANTKQPNLLVTVICWFNAKFAYKANIVFVLNVGLSIIRIFISSADAVSV